jgi:hypothetical protein
MTAAMTATSSEPSIGAECVKPPFVEPFGDVELSDVPSPLTSSVPLRMGNEVFVVDSRYMSVAGIFMHLLMGSS